MMRHYFCFSARPQVAHPGGMLLFATRGLLIAFARVPKRLATRLSGATVAAVDLAAVAVAANDHFATALPAKEQTARPRLGLSVVADEAWTNASLGRILALHSCPSRCGARRRGKTSR